MSFTLSCYICILAEHKNTLVISEEHREQADDIWKHTKYSFKLQTQVVKYKLFRLHLDPAKISFPPARYPPNKKIKDNEILTYILRSIFLEIPHLELPRWWKTPRDTNVNDIRLLITLVTSEKHTEHTGVIWKTYRTHWWHLKTYRTYWWYLKNIQNTIPSPAKNLQISSCSIATLSHVCNYKVQFCAFKGNAQNLPLRRVGRGEISPLAVPRG
jgi:hypothetical protein